MFLPGIATSIGSAIVILIFMVLFIILTTRWSKKRLKEISGRFDSELDQFTSKQQEIKKLENEISTLKQKKMDFIKSNNIQGAREIEDEIIRLNKRKDRIHEYIEKNY